MKRMELELNCNGSLIQTVDLNENGQKLTHEEMTLKIKEGKIVFSLGFGDDLGRVYLIEDNQFTHIGQSIHQESCDDMELSVESWNEVEI